MEPFLNPSNQPLTLPFALQERVAELEAAAATADAAAERERSECKAAAEAQAEADQPKAEELNGEIGRMAAQAAEAEEQLRME